MAKLSEYARSLQTTREWVEELMQSLKTKDEALACRALRVTLQELRDHLGPQEAAHFASQLPLLIRGVFYEGWRPTGKPVKRRSKDEFVENVGRAFDEIYQLEEVEELVRDVLEFLSRRISAGEIRDVVLSLPKELRDLWPFEGDRRMAMMESR